MHASMTGGLRVAWGLLATAARFVLRQPGRTAASLVAIVFGAVALILAAGFIEWSNWALRETMIHSRLGHFQVSRAGYGENGQANPFGYLIPEESEETRSIQALPGVEAVAPRLMFTGLVGTGDKTLSFMADGMDPDREQGLDRSVLIVAGRPLSGDDPDGVLIGEGLAINLGVAVGDGLVIMANTKSGGINAIDARVRGVFSTASKAYDDVALRVPLASVHRLLRSQGAHTWVVLLKSTEETDATIAQLRPRLQDKGLEITPWYELADFYRKTIALFDRQLGLLRFVIAAIIVLGITNILVMSVASRTGEIGTLMAMGANRRRIMGQFLGECIMLAGIGSLLGVLVGIGLARLISTIGIPLPAPPGQSRGYLGQVFVTGSIAADAVVLVSLATLLAGIYPAWRASRMVIVDALRHNR